MSVLTVTVHRARDLQIDSPAQRGDASADAYVEVRLANIATKRTHVKRGTLNPVWDESFRLEIGDDATLGTEPLVLCVYDRDVIRDDSIGVVSISLEPLLGALSDARAPEVGDLDGGGGGAPPSRRSLSGYFPIWDSLLGLRGYLWVTAGVRLFSTVRGGELGGGRSRFRRARSIDGGGGGGGAGEDDEAEAGKGGGASVSGGGVPDSSPGTGTGGVAFLSLDALEPRVYPYAAYCGFVEELTVAPDPEYLHIAASSGGAAATALAGQAGVPLPLLVQTPAAARKTNEARGLLLHKMTYALRASLAKKALLLGANAVIGFSVQFDVEGDSGLCGRATGTAVALYRPRLEDAMPGTAAVLADAAVARLGGLRGEGQGEESWEGGSRSAVGGGLVRDASGHALSLQGSADPYAALLAHALSQPELGEGGSSRGLPTETGAPRSGGLAASASQLAFEKAKDEAARTSEALRAREKLLLRGIKSARATAREERRVLRRAWAEGVAALRSVVTPPPTDPRIPVHRYGRGADYYRRPDTVDLLTVRVALPGSRLHIGGLVAARSVKYLGRLRAGALSDQETRDGWWAEVRREVREHALKLGCGAVLGYSETAHVCGDAIVLSAVGTAARLRQGQTLGSVRGVLAAAGAASHSARGRSSKGKRDRGGEGGEGLDLLAPAAARRAWMADPLKRAWYLRTIPGALEAAQAEAAALAAPTKRSLSSPISGGGPAAGGGGGIFEVESDLLLPPPGGVPARAVHGGAPPSTATALALALAPLAHAAVGVLPCYLSTAPSSAPSAPSQRPCSMLHLPYTKTSGGVAAPFNNMSVVRCRSCARAAVPSVLLATMELPPSLPITGPGLFIEASAVRRKDRGATGEAECARLSEELLFLEYAMHQQIMLKMRAEGRNAVFGVRSSIIFRGSLVIGTLSGTAVLVDALPPPGPFMARRGGGDEGLLKVLLERLQAHTAMARASLASHGAAASAAEGALSAVALARVSHDRAAYTAARKAVKAAQVAAIASRAGAAEGALTSALAVVRARARALLSTRGEGEGEREAPPSPAAPPLSSSSRLVLPKLGKGRPARAEGRRRKGGGRGKHGKGGRARRGSAASGSSSSSSAESSTPSSARKAGSAVRGSSFDLGHGSASSPPRSRAGSSSSPSSSSSEESDTSTDASGSGAESEGGEGGSSDEGGSESSSGESTPSESSTTSRSSGDRKGRRRGGGGRKGRGGERQARSRVDRSGRGMRSGVALAGVGKGDDSDEGESAPRGALSRGPLASESLRTYIIEVEDEQTEDVAGLLAEISPPPGVTVLSSSAPLTSHGAAGPLLDPCSSPPLLQQLQQEGEGEEGGPPVAVAPARLLKPLHFTLRLRWEDLSLSTPPLHAPPAFAGLEPQDRAIWGTAASLAPLLDPLALTAGGRAPHAHAFAVSDGALLPHAHPTPHHGSIDVTVMPGSGHGAPASDAARAVRLRNLALSLLYAAAARHSPCTLTGVTLDLSLPDLDEVEVAVSAALVREVGVGVGGNLVVGGSGLAEDGAWPTPRPHGLPLALLATARAARAATVEALTRPVGPAATPSLPTPLSSVWGDAVRSPRPPPPAPAGGRMPPDPWTGAPPSLTLCPCAVLPGATVTSYLASLHLYVVLEAFTAAGRSLGHGLKSSSARSGGKGPGGGAALLVVGPDGSGMDGPVEAIVGSLLGAAAAVACSAAAALGGDAVLSYKVRLLEVSGRGLYRLAAVSGDVVKVKLEGC